MRTRNLPMCAGLMMVLLSGCANTNQLTAGLTIAIPADCEKVLVTVPAPPKIKKGDSLEVAVAQRGAALSKANDRIIGGRTCISNVRKREARR